MLVFWTWLFQVKVAKHLVWPQRGVDFDNFCIWNLGQHHFCPWHWSEPFFQFCQKSPWCSCSETLSPTPHVYVVRNTWVHLTILCPFSLHLMYMCSSKKFFTFCQLLSDIWVPDCKWTYISVASERERKATNWRYCPTPPHPNNVKKRQKHAAVYAPHWDIHCNRLPATSFWGTGIWLFGFIDVYCYSIYCTNFDNKGFLSGIPHTATSIWDDLE